MDMRTVLITGGARGIGAAIAQRFGQQHDLYRVLTPTRQELDLSDNDSIQQYFAQHPDLQVDILINNAGINEIHNIDEITDQELEQTMQINLIAPIKITRALVPHMKKNHFGRIVNIGSIWAVVSKPGRCVYSATKNGIHGVTNTLAVELAPYNILVNTVCPGFTMTELTKKNNTDEQIRQISANIPLGRMAEPREIAEVVYFLASEQNTYLTGQKIAVDGGFTEQ